MCRCLRAPNHHDFFVINTIRCAWLTEIDHKNPSSIGGSGDEIRPFLWVAPQTVPKRNKRLRTRRAARASCFLCLPHTHSPSSPLAAAAVNGHQQKHQPNSQATFGETEGARFSPLVVCLVCGTRVCVLSTMGRTRKIS